MTKSRAAKIKNIEPLLRKWFSYEPKTGIIRYKTTVLGTKISKYEGDIAGVVSPFGYRLVSVKHVNILAHRLAWFLHYGKWPDGKLDHKDRNRDNNRIKNLRLARKGNQQNRSVSKCNTSGHTGVSFHKASGKWRAFIYVEEKQKSLGYHTTQEDAVAAYAEGKKKFHKFHSKVVRDLAMYSNAI